MKNLLKISLILLLSTISFLSFGQAYPSQLNFASPDASTKTFALTSINANATWIISPPTWVKVDKITGKGNATISVTVPTANPSFSAVRNNSITIAVTMNGQRTNLYVIVEQAVSTPVINVVPTTLTVVNTSSSNISSDFSFTSNYDWTIDAPAWINILDASNNIVTDGVDGSYSFKVQASENTDTQPRTGVVTFTSGGTTKTLTVTQAATTGTTTGIEDMQLGTTKLVTVYPNPSSGSFRIKAEDVAAVRVYSDSGAEIFTNENVTTDQVFEIANKGFYFVEVISSKGTKNVERLVIY